MDANINFPLPLLVFILLKPSSAKMNLPENHIKFCLNTKLHLLYLFG